MRKLFMIFAVAGFLFAGCSSNEVEEYNSLSPDAIKITASTTRAAVSDYESLKPGIKVWAKKNGLSSWYINDAATYLYTSGAWGWTGVTPIPTWPAASSGEYNMQFFAVSPAANEAGKTSFFPVTKTYPNLSGTVSIGGGVSTADVTTISADKQTDVLVANALAVAEKPASGYLPLAFQHILSKVNVGIIAGTGIEVEVQSVAIRNVKASAAYNFLTDATTTTKGWGAATATLTGYNYLLVADGRASFTTGNGSIPEPIFATTANRNLMLLPQTGASWNVSTNALALSTLNSGAYIEVVYRLVKTDSEIGYTDATDYLVDNPSYTDPAIATWPYSTIANYGARNFFIKVGFPLNTATPGANFTWNAGSGYTYNIVLGTDDAVNGNYTDDTYYDDEGNDTGIEIKKEDGSGEPVEPGDPVTTNYIYFNLSVTDFSDTQLPLQ